MKLAGAAGAAPNRDAGWDAAGAAPKRDVGCEAAPKSAVEVGMGGWVGVHAIGCTHWSGEHPPHTLEETINRTIPGALLNEKPAAALEAAPKGLAAGAAPKGEGAEAAAGAKENGEPCGAVLGNAAPNAGVLAAPNAGVLAAPNAGMLVAPNAGVLAAPNAGVDAPNNDGAGEAAPNAGVEAAPKAGVAPNIDQELVVTNLLIAYAMGLANAF